MRREPCGDSSSTPSQAYLDIGLDEPEEMLDLALRKLREALHRRGRLSSRNEALDEAGRLISAHIISSRTGGRGIGRHLLSGRKEGPAKILRDFVDEMSANLPESLSYEMSKSDFQLQMKETEDDLAEDILDSFENFDLQSNHIVELAPQFGGDLINHAFGRFLADSFADEKELGQYLTPTEVVDFMVQLGISELSNEEREALASPERFNEFGLVLDPSCGVGSFLASFVRLAHANISPSLDDSWSRAATRNLVVGIDKSERMIRLALANLATFGSEAANLHLANALSSKGRDGALTRSIENKAGLILTNPPFGATFEQSEVQEYKFASSKKSSKGQKMESEILFMARYMDWLRPGGQLIAVVPDSILTNKGIYSDLRNHLASNIEILSVVSLPPVTFAAAGTSTKTSILHLRKQPRPEKLRRRSCDTRFAVISEIGYTVSSRGAQRRKIRTAGGQLPPLLDQLIARSGPQVTAVSSVTEAHRWDATYHATLPTDVAHRISNDSALLTLGAVAEITFDRTDPRKGPGDAFPYIEISDVDGASLGVTSKLVARDSAPSRARRLVKSGDILLSTVRPERRAIGVVPDWLDGAVCTTGFAILRPHSINPMVLAALLRSDFVTHQLLRNNVGIAYPAIETSCLPGILLPGKPAEIAKLVAPAVDFQNASTLYTEMRTQFFSAVNDITN